MWLLLRTKVNCIGLLHNNQKTNDCAIVLSMVNCLNGHIQTPRRTKCTNTQSSDVHFYLLIQWQRLELGEGEHITHSSCNVTAKIPGAQKVGRKVGGGVVVVSERYDWFCFCCLDH